MKLSPYQSCFDTGPLLLCDAPLMSSDYVYNLRMSAHNFCINFFNLFGLMEKGVCLICLQVGGKMATFNEDAFWKEFRARLEVSQVR